MNRYSLLAAILICTLPTISVAAAPMADEALPPAPPTPNITALKLLPASVTLHSAADSQRVLPCPAVLFTHNVEAEIWRRHAETAGPAWKRFLLRGQWRRMLRFEGQTVARFDSVLAVSEADRDTLATLYPRQLRGPIHVIPTGVDL